MKKIKSKLIMSTAQIDCARIFFDTSSVGEIRVIFSKRVGITLSDMSGSCAALCEEVGSDKYAVSAVLDADRLYTMKITVDFGMSIDIDIEADYGVTVFIMPGLGVADSHGCVSALRLAGGQEHELWSIPDGSSKTADNDNYLVSVIRGIDNENQVHFSDGKPINSVTYPQNFKSMWYSTEIFTKAEAVHCKIDATHSSLIYNMWGTNITALCEPIGKLHTGLVSLHALGNNGDSVDARYELYIDETRVAMYDIMRDEDVTLELPVGKYRVRVSRGFRYSIYETEIRISGGECTKVTACFDELFHIPQGWVFGELHTHSVFNYDAAFPAQVLRAARANGLSFCFQTDSEVELLKEYEIERFNVNADKVQNCFLALTGQEIMCNEVHLNVLNTDRKFYNPEVYTPRKVNHDIKDKIGAWIDEYRRMKETHPCLFMHNHPSHMPATQKNGGAQFRSWWVSELFDDFKLVENFDTTTWYDRLNRGTVQFGAWTTDGHDCSLIMPGEQCVCVYVGDQLDEASVIDALENGRFFSLRKPGMFLDFRSVGERRVKIAIDSAAPLKQIELIADGDTVYSVNFDEENARDFCGEFELSNKTTWCHVKVRIREELQRNGHSGHWLMEEGCALYSNPLFFRSDSD